MNKEEIDKLKETLKEYSVYAIKLVKENKSLQQENKQLKDTCNKLKNIINELEKYIQECSYYSSEKDYEIIDTHDLLEKIEELEKGSEE